MSAEMENAVIVQLHVHLERVDGHPCWWADSPDVPGFSATADSLPEVVSRATWAIHDIYAEEGADVERVVTHLVGRRPDTGNPVQGMETVRTNVASAQAEVTAELVPA